MKSHRFLLLRISALVLLATHFQVASLRAEITSFTATGTATETSPDDPKEAQGASEPASGNSRGAGEHATDVQSLGKVIPHNVDTKDALLLNLGVIGARVKLDHRAFKLPRSNSDSGQVKFIFKNSLAEKKLKIDDVIVGVNGKKFKQNFSSMVAQAITKAEERGRDLRLMIERDGKAMKIDLPIRRLGRYSPTWPYKCKKSAQILQDACDWLVKQQEPSGRLENKANSPHFVLSSTAGIAMLGADPVRYKKPIKKIANFITGYLKAHLDQDGRFQSPSPLELWSLNYAAIFFSEYYLVSQDKSLLPTIELLNAEISRRQFHYIKKHDKETTDHIIALRKRRGDKGDPVPDYWFAHGDLDTKSSGYIHLGVNVANACMAWPLMAEAGVKVDTENLKLTKDFIEKACPVGNMGYGAQLGQKGHLSDSFGRTGALAVALHLDNDRPAYTKKVAFSLSQLQEKYIYNAHGTPIMGTAWGVLGMANLDPSLFRRVMDSCQNDFELLRLSDGSFAANPISDESYLKNDLLFGGNGDKHRWTTAFNAMMYSIGKKSLRITGAPKR